MTLMRYLKGLTTFLFFFLPPLLWLPLSADPSGFPKNALFVILALIFVLILGISLLQSNSLSITGYPFLSPLIFLIISFSISVFFTPNPLENITQPLGLATIVSLSLLFFATSQHSISATLALTGLVASIFLSSLASVISLFYPLGTPPQPFLPTGDTFSFVALSLVVISGGITYLWFSFKKGELKPLAVNIILPIILLMCMILGVFLWKSRPLRQSFAFLPYFAGWQISSDTLKTAPLWGRGPTNYLAAFTSARPLSLNADPVLWTYRFFVGSNTPLSLLTTAGLLGLSAYLFLIFSIIRSLRSTFSTVSTIGKTLSITVIVAIIFQFIFPPTIIIWWLLFALYSLYHLSLPIKPEPTTSRLDRLWTKFSRPISHPSVRYISSAVIILLFLTLSYLAGRALAAEFSYKSAINAINTGDGSGAYDSLIDAINLNPFMENYHITYSQVNLAIASAIASKIGSQPNTESSASGTLADQDRQTVTQLVQQGIREGKAAIAINPASVTGWENLASLYRNLLSFAQGADQWTIAAQKQAVILDPTNPIDRLQLGQLYYSLGDYDSALLFFQQSVDLKPDFANAHYNLAASYRQKNNYGNAIVEMQKVLSLISKDDPAANQIGNELDSLRQAAAATLSGKLKPSTTAPESPPETNPLSPDLQTPPPFPTPALRPPLDLGEDASTVPTPNPQ